MPNDSDTTSHSSLDNLDSEDFQDVILKPAPLPYQNREPNIAEHIFTLGNYVKRQLHELKQWFWATNKQRKQLFKFQ